MATHALTLTRPNESLTIVPVTEKSRRMISEHAKLPPKVTFLATHYIGSKATDTYQSTSPNLRGVVAHARVHFDWPLV